MKTFKKIPKSLDLAIELVYSHLESADIAYIIANSPGSVHHTFGMHLRNHLGLWKNGTSFKKDIKKRFNLFGHGDDCSGLILTGVWAKVRKKNVEQALSREAASYARHWTTQGTNPKTGKKI